MRFAARKQPNSRAIVACASLAAFAFACGGAKPREENVATVVVVPAAPDGGAASSIAIAKPTSEAMSPRAHDPVAATNDEGDSDDELLRKMMGPPGVFDHRLASAMVDSVDVNVCAQPRGPNGPGHALIDFQPSGIVDRVEVDPPFRATSVGMCIQAMFSGVQIPPFKGSSKKVDTMFVVP